MKVLRTKMNLQGKKKALRSKALNIELVAVPLDELHCPASPTASYRTDVLYVYTTVSRISCVEEAGHLQTGPVLQRVDLLVGQLLR